MFGFLLASWPAIAFSGALNLEESWNSLPHFSQTSVSQLPSTTAYKKTLPITVVLLKNSKWSRDRVIEKIRSTEEIYGQCEVSFFPITFVEVVHDQGAIVDASDTSAFFNLKSLVQNKWLPKPAVFFADSEINDHYEGGVAYRRAVVGEKDERVDTAVVFQSFADDDSHSYSLLQPVVLGSYEVMAHELGHLLFDLGHLQFMPASLMSVLSVRTNLIDTYLCNRIGAPPPKPGSSVSTF